MLRSTKIFLFSVFIASLALTGCQSSQPNDGIVIDDVPTDRRIGVITSLGGVPSTSSGTHILKLDDGDTILLKSLTINLDDSKYKNQAVEVRGVLTYTKGDKPLMEVLNIDILEDYDIQSTKAAEWKSYSGTLFTIRYRDDFELEKDSQGVTFTKTIEPEELDSSSTQEEETEPLTDVVAIAIAPKEQDQDLIAFLGLESDAVSDLLAEGLTKSKVGPLNLNALKNVESDTISFYVEGDINFYTLTFEKSDHPDALKHENIFYEMIATFELTSGDPDSVFPDDENDALGSRTLELDFDNDSSGAVGNPPVEEVTLAPVTGFETFESGSVGFGVQYPKSWYFEGANSSEAGISQVYSFSDTPFDEGGETIVSLSIATTDTSSGEVNAGEKTFGKTVTGSSVEITYRGNGRYFRFKGPKSMESTLLNMAASVTE